MDNEFDINDLRLISFSVNLENSIWIDKKIATLKNYDPGFYVQIIGVKRKEDIEYLYRISTHQINLEHEAFKKFIFQLELKLGNKLKIR